MDAVAESVASGAAGRASSGSIAAGGTRPGSSCGRGAQLPQAHNIARWVGQGVMGSALQGDLTVWVRVCSLFDAGSMACLQQWGRGCTANPISFCEGC